MPPKSEGTAWDGLPPSSAVIGKYAQKTVCGEIAKPPAAPKEKGEA